MDSMKVLWSTLGLVLVGALAVFLWLAASTPSDFQTVKQGVVVEATPKASTSASPRPTSTVSASPEASPEQQPQQQTGEPAVADAGAGSDGDSADSPSVAPHAPVADPPTPVADVPAAEPVPPTAPAQVPVPVVPAPEYAQGGAVGGVDDDDWGDNDNEDWDDDDD